MLLQIVVYKKVASIGINEKKTILSNPLNKYAYSRLDKFCVLNFYFRNCVIFVTGCKTGSTHQLPPVRPSAWLGIVDVGSEVHPQCAPLQGRVDEGEVCGVGIPGAVAGRQGKRRAEPSDQGHEGSTTPW